MPETSRARCRALYRLAVLVAGIFVLVGLTALPASAHHPELTAQANCDGTITYTATAWRSTDGPGRENPDVRIQVSVDGGAWTEIGHGSFAAASYAFSGTWDAGTPYPSSVRIRAYAAGAWGDHSPGGQTTTAIDVATPTGCTPTSVTEPTASITHDCTGYDVTLDNTASTTTVTYTVTVNGTSQQHTVAAGKTTHVTGPVTEDTDTTIRVTATNTTLAEKTFHTDCTPTPVTIPTALVTADCSTLTAALDNTASNVATTYTILRYPAASGDPVEQQVTLPAGATRTLTWPASQIDRLVVKAPGMTPVSASSDCDTDEPTTPQDPDTPTAPDTPTLPAAPTAPEPPAADVITTVLHHTAPKTVHHIVRPSATQPRCRLG